MSIKPSDIFPDSIDAMEIQGVNVRKGTIGAAIANAAILANPAISAVEKAAAYQTIEQLMPAMLALNLHAHLQWKNPEIQKIMENMVPQNIVEFS